MATAAVVIPRPPPLPVLDDPEPATIRNPPTVKKLTRGKRLAHVPFNVPIFAVGEWETKQGHYWCVWPTKLAPGDYADLGGPRDSGFSKTRAEAEAMVRSLWPTAVKISSHHARPGRAYPGTIPDWDDMKRAARVRFAARTGGNVVVLADWRRQRAAAARIS